MGTAKKEQDSDNQETTSSVSLEELKLDREFFILESGELKGPFTLEEMREKISSKKIVLSELISRDRGYSWMKIYEHPSFQENKLAEDDLPLLPNKSSFTRSAMKMGVNFEELRKGHSKDQSMVLTIMGKKSSLNEEIEEKRKEEENTKSKSYQDITSSSSFSNTDLKKPLIKRILSFRTIKYPLFFIILLVGYNVIINKYDPVDRWEDKDIVLPKSFRSHKNMIGDNPKEHQETKEVKKEIEKKTKKSPKKAIAKKESTNNEKDDNYRNDPYFDDPPKKKRQRPKKRNRKIANMDQDEEFIEDDILDEEEFEEEELPLRQASRSNGRDNERTARAPSSENEELDENLPDDAEEQEEQLFDEENDF